LANHALLIGVDRYGSRRESLSGSVADAIALGQWLVGPGQVAPENLRLALAPKDSSLIVPPELASCERVEPSLQGIDEALRVLRQTLAQAPAERLFIAFSGHGASANQPAYTEEALCLEGFTSSEYTLALEVRSFLMVIDAIAAAERFIFIDGCRNHVVEDDSRFGVLGRQPARAAGDLRNYILRATVPGRKAVEAGGRGLFSRHLVAGLNGEGTAKRFDFAEDGVGGTYRVTWSRLIAHVQKRISENVTAKQLKQLVQEGGERPGGYDPVLASYQQDSFPDSQLIISLKTSGRPPAGTKIRYLRDGELDPREVLFPIAQTEFALSLPQATFRLSARAPGHNWAPAQQLVELYEPRKQVEFALAENGPPPAPFAFVANAAPPLTEQPRRGPLLGARDPTAGGASAAESVPLIREAWGVVGFEDRSTTLRARTSGGTSYAVINGFSVIAFDPALSAQQQEDTVFLLYLAQRAANKLADRERDALAWREAYFNVLHFIGAAREQRIHSSESVYGGLAGTLEAARNLMGAAGATPAGGALAATLDELHSMLALHSLVVQDERTTIRDFELGTAHMRESDKVVLTLAGFRLITHEPRRILFFRFAREEAELQAQISTFVLDLRLHEVIRGAVMAKLRATLDVRVDGIPLAEIIPAPLLTITREAGTSAWHEIPPGNAGIALDPGLWRLQLTTADGMTTEQLVDVPPMEQVHVSFDLSAPYSTTLAATLAAAHQPPPLRGFITPTEIAGPIHHGSLVTIATFAVALAATQHRYCNLDLLGLGSLWHKHAGEGLEVVIADETGGIFRPATAWLNSSQTDKAAEARQLSRPDLAIPLAAAQFPLSPGAYLLTWRDEANAGAPKTMRPTTIVPGHVTLVLRQMPEEGGAFDFQFACARDASDLTATLKALARAEAVQRTLALGRDPAPDPNVAALAEGGWFEPFTAAQVAAAALDRGERELAAALADRLASSGALPADSAALAALLTAGEKNADDTHGSASPESVGAEVATQRLRVMLVEKGLARGIFR
jgi:hypothetical protein